MCVGPSSEQRLASILSNVTNIIEVFAKIMRSIREEEMKKPEDERNVYVPMTFESLISHLSYKILREDLEEKILVEHIMIFLIRAIWKAKAMS